MLFLACLLVSPGSFAQIQSAATSANTDVMSIGCFCPMTGAVFIGKETT